MLEIILLSNGVRTSVHGTQNTAKLSEEVNSSSKFEFTVNYGDESFDNIFPNITRVIAFDTDPSAVVFEGYVYSSIPKAASDGTIKKSVSAVHLSAMLCDSCVVGFEDMSGNVYNMVSRLLEIYNATAREEDWIRMGTGPRSGGHSEVVHISSATCWDAITQIVVTEAGWSFRMRYADGHWYLDIADDFGEMSKDSLIYGVNLTDISVEVNSSELYTRIIPIGGASYIPSDHINPTMSTLHGDRDKAEGMPLTLYKYFQDDWDRIYIANAALERKYPVKTKIVQYDDIVATDDTDFVTAQGNLYSKAVYDASKLTDIVESYEATALDLARAGYDYELIELNKMYHVVNNKIGIDTYLQVTSKKTDYANPAKSDLTFGGVGMKASKWMSRKGKTTDQKIATVGSASFKTTNTRMGGMSMRNRSKTEYESETHDINTLYTVSDVQTGKVEMYLGDTKISGSGGWEVDTAAVLDANNVHQWLAQEELMADVNPATKLLYGGRPLMAIVQQTACAWYNSQSMSTLPVDIAEYFGTKVEFDIMWRETKDDPYVQRHIVAEMVVNSKSYTTTSSGVTYSRYVFGLTVSRYVPGSDTAENVITRTRMADKAIDAFIVPIVSAVSANATYTNAWDNVTASTSTPHGYVEGNKLSLRLGFISSDTPDTITLKSWQSGSNDSNPTIGGAHRCVPLSSEAEKYFDISISKRSEPRGE